MYQVTNAYKNAAKGRAVQSRVTGTIDGVAFTDANIIQGSFSISNQCSGTETVQIGQVYIGELNITLRGLTLDRYSLEGKAVTAAYELLTAPDTWEVVPLGIYFISEASYSAAGLTVKAYDVLSKLDKPATVTTTAGKSFELATMACEACGVELATEESDFEDFANGTETLFLYAQENTDVQTWRDFLAWLSQACGCFVTATRDGKVAFRPYGSTVVDTLTPYQRHEGATFSDFETRYTGIYFTDIADNTVTYYPAAVDDGLTYNAGANPFLQIYVSDAVKERQRRAVLDALGAIDYVPFAAEVIDNPAYDLGDVLSFPDGLGDASKLFCVTKFTWTYHQKTKLEGVGKNPALATAQSKQEKNIEALASRISGDVMHYYDITNARTVTIGDGETKDIIQQTLYQTQKDTHVDFHAEMKLTVETAETPTETGDTLVLGDCTAFITYYINEVEIRDYTPILTEVDGVQLRHLLYTFFAPKDALGYFRVAMTVHGGTVTIPRRGLLAYLAGQGLVGDVQGMPSFSDYIQTTPFRPIGDFYDEVELVLEEVE